MPDRPISLEQLAELRLELDFAKLESSSADPVEAIVAHELTPPGMVFRLRTTRGVYVLVNPATLELFAPRADPPPPGSLVAVFGIPVLDRLPSDVELL